jgi:hypothetical protein
MKLYELNRNSKFKFKQESNHSLPIEEYTLDHIDGMYSVCYNSKGEVIHIAAFSDVVPIDKVEKV